MSKWDLFDYFDVWGNEVDGWEVNDYVRLKQNVEFDNNFSDNELITYLFLNEYVKSDDMDLYEIEDTGDFLVVYEKRSMKPLYGLQRVA